MSTVRYAIGLGCDRGTPQATLQQAIDEALAGIGAQLALLAGGGLPMAALVVPKHKHRGADGRHATVSIARMS